MRIEGNLKKGFFLRRETRFSAFVRISDKEYRCFLPNPGRMKELLFINAEVLLQESSHKERKTRYTIVGVRLKRRWISVDSRVPNKLIFEALKLGKIPEFKQYRDVKPEHQVNHSRIDFLLSNCGMCLLEVKSCTLIRDGVAFFPDAPTERGRKHIVELMKAKREGVRAAVLFLVQRIDATLFSPNDEADPAFSEKLRDAARNGVEVYAYTSDFTGREIILKNRMEVKL